jgi:hypothetical protein
MDKATITGTQMRILTYIAQHIEDRGFQPSYREIASHFGWKSLGYISYTVRALKTKGIVLGSGPRAVQFAWRNYVGNPETADVC